MDFFAWISVVMVGGHLVSVARGVAICKAGEKTPCYSCLHEGSCPAVDAPVTPGVKCDNGQVCVTTGGVGKCGPPAGSPCACVPYAVGCDVYDPVTVTMCISPEITLPYFIPERAMECPLAKPCSEGRCLAPDAKPECTVANVNKRYPHETDCKKYYTCREVVRGSYSYVVSTCLSTYKFDSVKLYCDIEGNVKNCP